MKPAIEVRNLGKQYELGLTHTDLLSEKLGNGLRAIGRRFRRNGEDSSNQNRSTQEPQEYFWALKDINFDVQQGEVMGVIGRNGAGKSTLLKILSRITSPTTGEVKLKGRVASLLEVGTGFHPELTGRENIYLNGAILGMKRQEISRKLDEIVAFAEVEKFIDTPVKRYSSGMYVRLAFAVAAHLECEILLVDEVLAVGDLVFQKKCLNKMEDVSGEGRTVLLVSHNMASVRQLTSRSILLEDGRLEEIGPTHQALEKYLDRSMRLASSPEAASDIKRHSWAGNRSIEFCSAALLKGRGAADATGTRNLELDIFSHIDVLSAWVALTICSVDGVPVSTAFSDRLRLEKEKKYRLSMVIDIEGLAPGSYWFRLAILNSHNELTDVIDEVLHFQVVRQPFDASRYIAWNPNLGPTHTSVSTKIQVVDA